MTRSRVGTSWLLRACAAGLCLLGGVSNADAQSLNPFGNPFAALTVPQKTMRFEIGADTASSEGNRENDFAVRVTRKVGAMSSVSASAWTSPRDGDTAPTFQIGAASALSQRAFVWVNMGGSPTSEHVPNSQYDFGGSYVLDPQLIFLGTVSIRNYQGGPSVKLLAPSLAWVVNPKVMLVATAINSHVSRLAPGVTAGSNSALFNLIVSPSPTFTLNLGTGYGESDFLAAALTQSFSANTTAANFNAAATWKFTPSRGVLVSYWLDQGNGAYKTLSFQASAFFEF